MMQQDFNENSEQTNNSEIQEEQQDDNKIIVGGITQNAPQLQTSKAVSKGFNPLLKEGVSIEYTQEQIVEIAKCMHDPIYMCNHYCKITTQDHGLTQMTLRPYQETIIKSAILNQFTICKLPRQSGKNFPNWLPLPSPDSPDGFIKMGDIKVGDRVFDEFGNPTNVTFVSEEQYVKSYKFIFSDGTEIISCEDHNWPVKDRFFERRKMVNGKRVKDYYDVPTKIMTTKEILDDPKWRRLDKGKTAKRGHDVYEYKYYIPNCEPVKYPKKDVLIDPYLLGLWLGDGFSRYGGICGIEEHLEFYKTQLPNEVFGEMSKTGTGAAKKYKIENFYSKLNKYGLIQKKTEFKTKRIPHEYLFNDVETRIAVLQGLIDTDGWIENKKGTVNIALTAKNTPLIDDVQMLVESLGLKVTRRDYPKTNSIRLAWSVGRDKFDVCRIPYKLERQPKTVEQPEYVYSRTIVDIVPVENITGRCIQVDSPNHLYLASKHFIPTHNTECMAMLILWMARFTDNFNIGIVAQNEDTAKKILKRIKVAWENFPDWLKIGTISWNEKSIEFENRSSIVVSGTSGAATRGSMFNLLYMDEFAFVPPHVQTEFYVSTYPTISSGKTGKIIITSTPRGLDMFYKIWTDSERGQNDFHRIAIEWYDVPGRDEAWKQTQIRQLGEDKFKQEFNCLDGDTELEVYDTFEQKYMTISIKDLNWLL